MILISISAYTALFFSYFRENSVYQENSGLLDDKRCMQGGLEEGKQADRGWVNRVPGGRIKKVKTMVFTFLFLQSRSHSTHQYRYWHQPPLCSPF